MKKIILSIISFATITATQAQQVSDMVSTSSGIKSVFYSLANGEVSAPSNEVWDLAFNTNLFEANIRINGAKGVELYAYPAGDTSDFMTLDTTGLSTWESLHNSTERWQDGAFNANATSAVFDFGWGVYNSSTNTVNGDSLFVVKTITGEVKKLWLKSLTSGGYNFKYSNLDNSDMIDESVLLANYSNKNYFYYSLDNNIAIDREPAKSEWDFVATVYNEFQTQQGVHYPVTGILTNKGVNTREARNTDVTTASWSNFPEGNTIDVIGSDWKTFNMTTFTYDIEADLSYFITDQVGNIWQVIFTDFGGSLTGNIDFTKEMISAVSIDENVGINLGIYPNPTTNQVTLLYDNSIEDKAMVTILDLQGKTVYSNEFRGEGFNQHTLDVSFLTAGVYNVLITTTNRVGSQKLVVQ